MYSISTRGVSATFLRVLIMCESYFKRNVRFLYRIVYFFNVFRKSTNYAQARLHLTLFAIPFGSTWAGQAKDITQTKCWRMISLRE